MLIEVVVGLEDRKKQTNENLSGGFLKVGNEVLAVLLLLKTSENHLSAGDHLLRVDEVLHERLLVPFDT